MKNFTNLINSLLEAKSLKGAKALLSEAAGAGHVDLPARISKKFLRIVAEENAAFSSDFLYEEEHYRGKTLPATHFWVDSDNFHHCSLDEARASMVLQAAICRKREGYKNILYFNLLWKTTEEQEAEEADWEKYFASIDEAEEEAKKAKQQENVKYIMLDEAEEILNKAVEEAEAAAKSKEGVVRPLEEILKLLPKSSRNKISSIRLEEALEENIICAEEAQMIIEAGMCF